MGSSASLSKGHSLLNCPKPQETTQSHQGVRGEVGVGGQQLFSQMTGRHGTDVTYWSSAIPSGCNMLSLLRTTLVYAAERRLPVEIPAGSAWDCMPAL